MTCDHIAANDCVFLHSTRHVLDSWPINILVCQPIILLKTVFISQSGRVRKTVAAYNKEDRMDGYRHEGKRIPLAVESKK